MMKKQICVGLVLCLPYSSLLAEAAQADKPLHDPTRLSAHFYSVLKKAGGSRGADQQAKGKASNISLPSMTVLARAKGGRSKPSAIIQIGKQHYFVRAGSKFNVVSPNGDSASVEVKTVGPRGIDLLYQDQWVSLQ